MIKRNILAILLSAVVVSTVEAQGPLDHATRDQVARCTVRLDVSKAGGGTAQGSGTIVSPDGIIFTSAHVVEDANEIQVLTFDGYEDEPVLQYFAQVILISDDLDFAILQIHQDRSRQSITTSQLNLPYLTSWNTSVEVGDDMVIFSYPQMGRQRLTMTAGIISAIQLQPFGGDRFRVYLSDAEFGEGGSGGAVVNSRGEFIGIPYEYSSGPDKAQLAIILPIETICEVQSRACDYQPDLPVNAPPTTTGTICPGLPTPRLQIGEQGIVIDSELNNIRGERGSTEILGQIPPGAVFNVLDGPSCPSWAQRNVWWFVEYNGIVGWTAESAKGVYWLAPYE